ncbi:hypothetical protein ACHAXS_007756 [Conticribra weissflogii]
MIRSKSEPISHRNNGAKFSYASISKSKSNKQFPALQRFSPGVASGYRIHHDGPEVCEGYVLCIPPKDSNSGGGHIDSDDASDISDVTFMTFHMEQWREQRRQETATFGGFRSYKCDHVDRRGSDGNISKATNVGVLEVEFGSTRSSVEIDADANNQADADMLASSAPRIKTNETNNSEAHMLLIEHIIELKLELAQKQAALDGLSSECNRLGMENDHLKNRLEKFADQAKRVHWTSENNATVDNKKNLNQTHEILQLFHLENEIESTKNAALTPTSFERCPVLKPVPEHISGEVDGDKVHGASSRDKSNNGSSGIVNKLC